MLRRIGRMHVVRVSLAWAMMVGALACAGDQVAAPPPKPALAIASGGGDAQSGTVGSTLPQPIAVQITGVSQLDGQVLNFVVTSGGGTVFAGVVMTGAPTSGPWAGLHGIATNTWTLGPTAGPQTIQARLIDPTTNATITQATFAATATAAPASVIKVVSIDPQTAVVGSAVKSAPSVLVTDQYGNPVGGIGVSFAVASGGGTITSPSQTTGTNGIATVANWTLGPTVGTNTATATSPGLTGNPLTFTATSTAGGAATLIAPSPQFSAQGGTTVHPVVRAVDANGNGVANIAVTFTVTGGGGSVDGVGSVTTLTSAGSTPGSATVNWTLGSTTAGNTLQATAEGLNGSPVVLSAVQPPVITSFTPGAATITSGTATTLTAVFSNGSATIDHGIGAVTSGVPVSTGVLTATTTYTLTVVNVAGVSVTSPVTITVVPPPVITSFTAAAGSVSIGGATTLTAVFSGGTGTVDHGIGAVTSGVAVSTGALSATTTFALTVTNAAGATATAQVTVSTPTIKSFVAAAPTITAGTSTTLSAVFSGGTGAINQGIGAVTSGVPISTGVLNATTVFTLTISDASSGSTATAQVTVTVVPAPAIVSFSAQPTSVNSGTASVLTAVFTGGSGVVDGGIGPVVSGTPISTGNLAATTTYTLTVTSPAGAQVTAQTTVTVVGVLPVMNGLVVLLDAGVAVSSVNSGGHTFVTSWGDPNTGFHADAPDSGSRPQLVTGLGAPAILFSGAQRLLFPANEVPGGAISAYTFIAVCSRDGTVSADAEYQTLMTAYWSVVTASNPGLNQWGVYTGDYAAASAASTNVSHLWYGGASLGRKLISITLHADNSSDFYENGVFVNTNTQRQGNTDRAYTAFGQASVGAEPAGGIPLVGRIWELVVYNRALSTAELTLVQNALKAKFGL